jgi:predicted amidophosphoribosyltransferase
MEDAIAPHPRRGAALAGRPVLLADDVMTSGATLAAAAATAARAAGATDVRILVVARALLDP